jgi:hypothetical protein
MAVLTIFMQPLENPESHPPPTWAPSATDETGSKQLIFVRTNSAQGRNRTTDTRIFSFPRKIFKALQIASNRCSTS